MSDHLNDSLQDLENLLDKSDAAVEEAMAAAEIVAKSQEKLLAAIDVWAEAYSLPDCEACHKFHEQIRLLKGQL